MLFVYFALVVVPSRTALACRLRRSGEFPKLAGFSARAEGERLALLRSQVLHHTIDLRVGLGEASVRVDHEIRARGLLLGAPLRGEALAGGGVGPLTIAMLLKNTLAAAQLRAGGGG